MVSSVCFGAVRRWPYKSSDRVVGCQSCETCLAPATLGGVCLPDTWAARFAPILRWRTKRHQHTSLSNIASQDGESTPNTTDIDKVRVPTTATRDAIPTLEDIISTTNWCRLNSSPTSHRLVIGKLKKRFRYKAWMKLDPYSALHECSLKPSIRNCKHASCTVSWSTRESVYLLRVVSGGGGVALSWMDVFFFAQCGFFCAADAAHRYRQSGTGGVVINAMLPRRHCLKAE